jgi:hypothetical protein
LSTFNKNSFGDEKEEFYAKLIEGLKEKFLFFAKENDDLFKVFIKLLLLTINKKKKEISALMEIKITDLKNQICDFTFQNLADSISNLRSELTVIFSF